MAGIDDIAPGGPSSSVRKKEIVKNNQCQIKNSSQIKEKDNVRNNVSDVERHDGEIYAHSFYDNKTHVGVVTQHMFLYYLSFP